MKHIFIIHSNITYLSALGVICTEKLDTNHCILASEGYTPPPGVDIEIQYFPYWHGLKANKYNPLRYFRPAAYTDKKVDKITSSTNFTLYMSVANKLARTLMTNPQCRAFHFIEEGLSAYSIGFAIQTLTAHNAMSTMRSTSFWSRLKDSRQTLLRGYTSRLGALPIFYNAYAAPDRKFYGFTPESHTLIDANHRVEISMQHILNRFSIPSTIDLSSHTIWLGDCIDAFGSDIDSYFRGIESGFIKKILNQSGIKSILVKFHYREGENSRRRTLDLFNRHGISVSVLPDNTLLEIELLHTNSAYVYGSYSSLLLYASLSGNHAFSIDRHYGHGMIDARIPLFWNYVNKI